MKESIQKIAPKLYQISIPLMFGPDFVHIFAVTGDDNQVTLIDTGPYFFSTESMFEDILASIGRSLKDVDRILLTHSHVDHCGFAGRIKEISGAKIHISKMEYESNSFALNSNLRIDLLKKFWKEHGVNDETIDSACSVLKSFRSVTASFTTDLFLEDMETIQVGGRAFRVILTPGHTRGHICLYLPEERILLAGDIILRHITPNLSPDLSYPSFRPLEQFFRSLDRIKDLPAERVYPAHGEPFSDLKGRVDKMKQHHLKKKELMWSKVTQHPRTTDNIARKIFGDSLSAFDHGLAVNETYAHLVYLQGEGLIKEIRKNDMIHFMRS